MREARSEPKFLNNIVHIFLDEFPRAIDELETIRARCLVGTTRCNNIIDFIMCEGFCEKVWFVSWPLAEVGSSECGTVTKSLLWKLTWNMTEFSFLYPPDLELHPHSLEWRDGVISFSNCGCYMKKLRVFVTLFQPLNLGLLGPVALFFLSPHPKVKMGSFFFLLIPAQISVTDL